MSLMQLVDKPYSEWTDEDVAGIATGHEYILEYYTAYDWRRPKVPHERERMSSGDSNICGHQQRAFNVALALQHLFLTGEVGLEIGSMGVKTPWCLDTDGRAGKRSTYDVRHFVGGKMLLDGGKPLPFMDECFNLVLANHVLEHIQEDPVSVLLEWLRVTKPGGVVGIVVPDNAHVDVRAVDRTHCHAWSAKAFKADVLSRLADVAEVRSFDTFDNNFSFEAILVRR